MTLTGWLENSVISGHQGIKFIQTPRPNLEKQTSPEFSPLFLPCGLKYCSISGLINKATRIYLNYF